MNPTETVYRDHAIVIRDKQEFPTNALTGTVATLPVTSRIIEVDHVDVTNRCRMVATDELKIEEGRRFVDRMYPKGKSDS
jgi:hypothetical protein